LSWIKEVLARIRARHALVTEGHAPPDVFGRHNKDRTRSRCCRGLTPRTRLKAVLSAKGLLYPTLWATVPMVASGSHSRSAARANRQREEPHGRFSRDVVETPGERRSNLGGGRHSLQDVHLARPEMSISGWSFDYFTGGGTA
jgi:hypothetical protein